jgi:Fe2+ transport system protein FeoA
MPRDNPEIIADAVDRPADRTLFRIVVIAAGIIGIAAAIAYARLDLTPKEFQLLEYFLLHPEEVVRRTTLLEKVWDMHFDPESNVVDVHVGNLRRKLTEAAGEPLLVTVRGVGFSLRRGADAEISPTR